jgi:hypothetical protein
METIPFLKHQMTDKVQKHDYANCNTPSSEPFRIGMYCVVHKMFSNNPSLTVVFIKICSKREW